MGEQSGRSPFYEFPFELDFGSFNSDLHFKYYLHLYTSIEIQLRTKYELRDRFCFVGKSHFFTNFQIYHIAKYKDFLISIEHLKIELKLDFY